MNDKSNNSSPLSSKPLPPIPLQKRKSKLSEEQIATCRNQLKDICLKLRKVKTDGKEKVKAFETFVVIAKTLKSDLRQCFEPSDEITANDETNHHHLHPIPLHTKIPHSPKSPPKSPFSSFSKLHTSSSTTTTSTSTTAESIDDLLDSIPTIPDETAEETDVAFEKNFILTQEYFVKTLRILLAHRSSYLRAATVRSIRYCCKYVQLFSRIFWTYHCHFFLAKMFDADKKNVKEKKQAFDLMRILSRSEEDALIIPVILVKSLVGIAENPDDTYKYVATEILRDLMLNNPKVVALSNGFRTMFSAVLNPKFKDIADSILTAFLYLFDDRDKRKYIRSGYDVQYIISPFTQGYIEDKKLMKEQWEAAKKAICFMMKCWTGLICLSEKGTGIESLVAALLLPDDETRKEILFDTIIDILRGASPLHYHYLIPQLSTEAHEEKDDRISHLNVFKRSVSQSMINTPQQLPEKNQNEPAQGDNILMVYLAMTILSFIQNGLVNALLTLSKTKDQPNISQRASQILQSILAFSDMLFSSDRCLSMHDLFDSVVSRDLRNDELFVADRKRSKILSMLTLYTHQTKQIYKKDIKDVPRELVKALQQVNTSMDDNQFNLLVRESNVMQTKDDKKWNWEKVTILVFGPLKTPSRLQEALNSKLIRRIFVYFFPSSKLFGDLAYKEDAKIYASVGEQLIENLLSTNEGCQFLRKCGFLDELRDILQIELQPNPESNPNRTFSEEKVTYKMAREYFTFIGKLSSFPQGVELLQDFKIFATLHKLTTTRDDICQLIIKALDYSKSKNIVKPARSILKQAMEKGSRKTRYFSTLRIRRLVRESVDFHTWGIELLNNQLTDSWEEVARNALKILSEACQEPENLDALTSLRPAVEPFEQHDGRTLLLRIVSRPNGFFYLYEIGWIQKMMQQWMETTNTEYVTIIEEALERCVSGQLPTTSHAVVSEKGICLPPHFFGELCKTNEGCELFRDSGHFNSFIATLTEYEQMEFGPQHTDDTTRKGKLLDLRAALWAIGNIGASDVGFHFIEESNATERLIKLAEHSHSLSLRGSVMYVMGVMCKSGLAQEKLAQFGWEFHTDHVHGISICMPSDPTTFFTVSKYDYEGSGIGVSEPYFPLDHNLPDTLNATQKNILKQISLLANPVQEVAATKTLKRFKTTDSTEFTPTLMYYVFGYLSKYRYSLRTKKLIFQELFASTSFTAESFDILDSLFIPR